MNTKKDYDLNISKTSGRFPGKGLIREFYDSPVNAWESWETGKPEIGKLRIGTLGEPTGHSDFPELLKALKEYSPEYITDGLVFGVPGDPRADVLLEATEKYCNQVILLKSTKYFRRALDSLLETGVRVIIGISDDKDIEGSKEDYLYIPKYDLNLNLISPESLKDVKKIDLRPQITLGSEKIIITENSLNLKPTNIYDRV